MYYNAQWQITANQTGDPVLFVLAAVNSFLAISSVQQAASRMPTTHLVDMHQVWQVLTAHDSGMIQVCAIALALDVEIGIVLLYAWS